MASVKSKPILNPRNFPRPPALERLPETRLQVRWRATGQLIADCYGESYRVLETWHPPSMVNLPSRMLAQTNHNARNAAYYLPRSSVLASLTQTPRRSYCEWKGNATYWTVSAPQGASSQASVSDRVWSYESPNPSFASIKGFVSFYASAGTQEDREWDCYVDGEKVEAQDGDFYGGWKTSEIQGPMKGAAGTRGW